MSASSPLRFTCSDGVARIVLNRPAAGNALNLRLCEDLLAAAETCAADPAVRAVLLSAEGAAFCVGGDLVEFRDQGERRPTHLARVADVFHAAQAKLMSLDAPVIVAIQGATAGAGFGLAMCGDLVLAGDRAHFTAAYTAIGLSADGGSTHLLPRLIGLRRTQELLLLNRRLSAAEAVDWGLVTRVTSADALAGEAEALVRRMSAGPTPAFGAIKRLLGQTYGRDFGAQTLDEGATIARLSGGPQAAEGLAAFFEKRAPVFGA